VDEAGDDWRPAMRRLAENAVQERVLIRQRLGGVVQASRVEGGLPGGVDDEGVAGYVLAQLKSSRIRAASNCRSSVASCGWSG